MGGARVKVGRCRSVPAHVDAPGEVVIPGTLECSGHRLVSQIGVCGDAFGALGGQHLGPFGEQFVDEALASVAVDYAEVGDHEAVRALRRNNQADRFALWADPDPPPCARTGIAQQFVVVLHACVVVGRGTGDVGLAVGIQRARQDAGEKIDRFLIGADRAEGQTATV